MPLSPPPPPPPLATNDAVRKVWDKAAFARRAAERAAAADAPRSRPSRRQPTDDTPGAPTRAWLTARTDSGRLAAAIAARVGSDDLVTGGGGGGGVGGVGGGTGPGFACRPCGVLVKDSRVFLAHLNSRRHQRTLGVSMRVRRSDTAEVAAAFDAAIAALRARRASAAAATAAAAKGEAPAEGMWADRVARAEAAERARRAAKRAAAGDRRRAARAAAAAAAEVEGEGGGGADEDDDDSDGDWEDAGEWVVPAGGAAAGGGGTPAEAPPSRSGGAAADVVSDGEVEEDDDDGRYETVDVAAMVGVPSSFRGGS